MTSDNETCELINGHLYEGMVAVPRPLRRHPRDFAGLISQQNSTDTLTHRRHYRAKPEGASAYCFQADVAGPVAIAVQHDGTLGAVEFLGRPESVMDIRTIATRLGGVFLGAHDHSAP